MRRAIHLLSQGIDGFLGQPHNTLWSGGTKGPGEAQSPMCGVPVLQTAFPSDTQVLAEKAKGAERNANDESLAVQWQIVCENAAHLWNASEAGGAPSSARFERIGRTIGGVLRELAVLLPLRVLTEGSPLCGFYF